MWRRNHERSRDRSGTAWDRYLAAIDELDSARRNAAAAVASQEHAARSAQIELRRSGNGSRCSGSGWMTSRCAHAGHHHRSSRTHPTGRAPRSRTHRGDGSDAGRESGSDGRAGCT